MNPRAYGPNPVSWVDPLGWCAAKKNVLNDEVTLYHGSQDFKGDKFDLSKALEGQRDFTPEAGVYLTDDFNRAATQYAGPGGSVVKVNVSKEFAEKIKQQGGPTKNRLTEYFVNTQDGINSINQNTQKLSQGDAIREFFKGNF
jgi:hypothetical protein